MNEVRIIPIQGIPEIKVDDNLAEITFDALSKSEIAVSYTHLRAHETG